MDMCPHHVDFLSPEFRKFFFFLTEKKKKNLEHHSTTDGTRYVKKKEINTHTPVQPRQRRRQFSWRQVSGVDIHSDRALVSEGGYLHDTAAGVVVRNGDHAGGSGRGRAGVDVLLQGKIMMNN